MSIAENFIDNAINAADLLQGYVDNCIDNIEKLSDEDKTEVAKLIANRESSTGAEEAGAIGILNHLLNVESETP